MTNSERIWVDADACPKVVKEILYRAAARVGVTVTLVANQALDVPGSPYIQFVQVPMGLMLQIATLCNLQRLEISLSQQIFL